MNLFNKVLPFLRQERPANAAAALDKTDTICGALKLALRKGEITEAQHDAAVSHVQDLLEKIGQPRDSGSIAAHMRKQWPSMTQERLDWATQCERYRVLMHVCAEENLL